MPFLLLLFLMFACLPEKYPEPLVGGRDPGLSAALTGLAMALAVAGAALAAFSTRWQLSHHTGQRDLVLRRYGSWRLFHMLGLCFAYGLCLYVLGWGWAVQTSCQIPRLSSTESIMAPGAELFILAPFIIALVLSWACLYDVERALHDTGPLAESAQPFWTRWAYVGFHARHTLGWVSIPIVLMMLQKGFLRQFPDLQDRWPVLMGLVGMALLVGVFIGLPWILRLVLGLRPLPEGPLRDRLLAAARRMHFRFSNVLLWNTHGVVVNAMVVGVLPFVRYVLLTDRLISDLSADEVEAVFGHEVGHVKHHHMLYYMGFLLVSLAVVVGVWSLVQDQLKLLLGLDLEAHGYLEGLPFVGILGTYIFVVFGFLSRRCERQADIYGCRAVSCAAKTCAGHDGQFVPVPGATGLCPTGIRIFIEALEKVARLNGISRDHPGWLQSWQHSTIGRRVEFLQRLLIDPSLEPRFQRTVRLVKWTLLLGLGATLLGLGALQGWEAVQNSLPF